MGALLALGSSSLDGRKAKIVEMPPMRYRGAISLSEGIEQGLVHPFGVTPQARFGMRLRDLESYALKGDARPSR